MKVKRYHTGQQVVGKLKEQRARMLTPEEAGQAAGAKYNMIADVADTAAGAMNVIAEKERQTKAKQAAVDLATNSSYATAAMESLADEARKNNWTEDQMRQNGEAILKAYEDSVNQIDPQFRGEAENAMRMNKALYTQQLREMTVDYSDERSRNKLSEGWAVALDAKDTAQMKFLLDVGRDAGYVDTAKGLEMEGKIKAVEDQNTVDDLYDDWRTAKNPESVHAAIVNNSEMDADVRDAAIKRIEAEINNQVTLEKQQVKQAAIGFERQFNDLIIAAKTGQDVSGATSAFINEIDSFGSDILSNKASDWERQLMLASVQGAKTQVDQSQFVRAVATNKGYMPYSTKATEHMSQFVADSTPPNATPGEAALIKQAAIKSTGIPTQDVAMLWKAGGDESASARPLADAAVVWADTHEPDATVVVKDGLSAEERTRIVQTAEKIKAGVPPQVAAEEVIKIQEMYRGNPDLQRSLMQKFGGISEDIGENYDDMVESYDPWMEALDFTAREDAMARERYRMYYKQSYLLSAGDEAAAKAAADLRFQQTHALTYINGEAELMYNGRREGSMELGNSLFENDLKGQTFIAMDGGRSHYVKLDDRDSIKFRNPRMKDGVQEYQVYYNDAPMFSEDNRQSVWVAVDSAAERVLMDAADAEEIGSIEEQINDLEAELKRAEPRFNPQTGAIMRYDTGVKERDIPKEIAQLQRRLRQLQ